MIVLNILRLVERVEIAKSPHPKHTALYLLMVSSWIITCTQLDWMFMMAIPSVIVIGFESIHKTECNFSLFKR